MIRSVYGALAALTLTSTGCGAAQDANKTSSHDTGETAPAKMGLDASTMEQVLNRAENLPNIRSLIVMRGGEELVARRFHGGAALDDTVNIKSASKSVISALVGIAIYRGIFDGVDQPILTELSSHAPREADPRLSRLTIGNLLSMQAGLERTSGENYGRWVSSPNWVRYALSRPFVEEPGGAMLYSTGSTHLLSAMLTEASGRSTWALAQEWLADPLNVAIPQWERDPQGIYLGGNQMAMSPRGMAKFGELYRLGGAIDGKRLLPEEWVELSWKPQTTSPWSGEQYGYGWFISDVGGHELYYAWGYGGQMIYVVPDLELTVVMTSTTDVERGGQHIAALRSLLAEGIVPAAKTGGRF